MISLADQENQFCNFKPLAAAMLNQAQFFGGAFGALPHAIRNAGLRGVSDDTARTAREITAMVGDYYAKSGGQPLRSEKKPKILVAGNKIAGLAPQLSCGRVPRFVGPKPKDRLQSSDLPVEESATTG
jgi:hypothetical protein